MKRIATIWVWSLVALTACEHVVERETSSAERMGAKAEVELPQPDESGTYFLWTPCGAEWDTRSIAEGGSCLGCFLRQQIGNSIRPSPVSPSRILPSESW